MNENQNNPPLNKNLLCQNDCQDQQNRDITGELEKSNISINSPVQEQSDKYKTMEDETDERDESVDDFDAIDQQEIKLTKKPGFSQ